MPGNLGDRKTYIAIKGTRAKILSSDPTAAVDRTYLVEGETAPVDQSQRERSVVFKFAKRTLPPSIKNAIKPALRAIRVLPPDETPEFLKKKNRT